MLGEMKSGKFFENQIYVVEEAELIGEEFQCVNLVAVCRTKDTARMVLKQRVNRLHDKHEGQQFSISGQNGYAEVVIADGPTYRVYTTVRELFD